MFSGLRPLTVLLAAAALGATLLVAPVQAAPADRYADAAFRATNAQRADHDRRELREAACLTRYAEKWARHMARHGRLVHQDLQPVAARCHLSWVGENIATGFRSGTAVVNRGWMHSAGHRENILRPQYRLMGIGARRDGHGRWWVSQVFGRR
ncbi:CAP domain-containing protein [Nocardioides conyzicola]|uniref:SCP domain-containing protein n=1 Tax=Nocardioides conyzicola TaxID=1651781 RepID=A0ABP8WX54_9ACTN